MVKLNLDFRGYEFRIGLNVLESNFRTSAEALAKNVTIAQEKLADYVASGDNHNEYDDDGNIVASHEQVLEYDIRIAQDSQLTFRKSFMIPLYHHWERYVRSLSPKYIPDHKGLVELLFKAKGITPDGGLDKLHYLVNILKHNNRRWVEKLFPISSHMFPPKWIAVPDRIIDWYEMIRMNDDDVYDFIEIVRRSGPQEKSIFVPDLMV